MERNKLIDQIIEEVENMETYSVTFAETKCEGNNFQGSLVVRNVFTKQSVINMLKSKKETDGTD